MDLQGLSRTLEAAWNRRRALLPSTDAFRLLNGAASGVPGLVIDHYAGWLAVYAYSRDPILREPDFAERLKAATGARGAALIDRGAKGEAGRDEGSILFGEVPETAEVREGGLRFRVHPRHPRNVGLFLDTRGLRARLAEDSRDADVLNLFAYSCSLGIAASAGGASLVANVDVSARYLGWGRENLALNGLPPERSRFVKMDGGKYLDWAAKKGIAYDAVILDPPSFGRSREGTFAFARDYFRLAGVCAALLRPGGVLHALTNYGGIAPAAFRSRVEEGLRAAGRRIESCARILPPEDFDSALPPLDPGSASGPGVAVEGTLIGFSFRTARSP